MGFPFIPNRRVEVPEIPFKDDVKLMVDKTALIIVDMQNDFVKPGGNLVVPSAIETVDNIHDMLNRARDSGVYVAFTQDTHYNNDFEWDIWPEHCRIKTWGWQIIDELKPEQDELVVIKNRYDGFYGSQLEHYLKNVWDVENVIIAGTVSNICVAHTAASAGLRWFYVVVPADGISALTEFDQALTLRQVSALYSGSVVKTVKDIQFKKEVLKRPEIDRRERKRRKRKAVS